MWHVFGLWNRASPPIWWKVLYSSSLCTASQSVLRIPWPVYIHKCTFSVNTERYWFPCQNTRVLWDCYLYTRRHCEQNTVSFHTRECICKYGIEFINILLFADKGLNFKHFSPLPKATQPKSLQMSFWTVRPRWLSLLSCWGHKPKLSTILKDTFFFFGNLSCMETIVFNLWHQVWFPQANDTLPARCKSRSSTAMLHTVLASWLVGMCLCDSRYGTRGTSASRKTERVSKASYDPVA